MSDTGKFDSKLKKKKIYIYIFVLIHTPLLSPCLMIEINDICIKIQFLLEEGKNTQFWYNYREYDLIQAVDLKYADSGLFFLFIFTLISQIWTSIAPKSWKLSRLQPIYKNKGSQNDPAMHRGLMVNATIGKVLVTCLLDRLRYHYENLILPS